jgi:hypothetical protein
VIDAPHRAGEQDRHAGGVGGDRRAVALEHPPVDAAVVVTTEITGRDPLEVRPADIGADRVDQAVPAAERLEKGRGRNVVAVGERIEPLLELLQRVEKGALLRQRETDGCRASPPRRRRLVDRAALCLGDTRPGIAVGRVQPAAAEVDCRSRAVGDRPRPPAEP